MVVRLVLVFVLAFMLAPAAVQAQSDGWFVYMNGSQTFAGPFSERPGCQMLADYLDARFKDYFTCQYSPDGGVDDSTAYGWWVERTVLSSGRTSTFAGPFETRSDCQGTAAFLDRNFVNSFSCRYF